MGLAVRRALDRGAISRLPPELADHRGGGPPRRSGSRPLPRCRAPHLGVLRRVPDRRGSLAPARQLSRGARQDRRPPYLADEHRLGVARERRRTRPRVSRSPGARDPPRKDARRRRRPGALGRASAQLVRHAVARAARAALRLDRRQRQPGRGAHGARRGPRRAAARSGARARRGPRAAPPRPRHPRPHARERDRLPPALRPTPPALCRRLPASRSRRTGAPRQLVLRPPRVGGAARELRGDREGRRARAALVRPRPAAHRDRRPRHAVVVERHDVRVSVAARLHPALPGDAARRSVSHGRGAATPLRHPARRAVGDFRVGVPPARPRRPLSVSRVRRARPRLEARTR